MKRFLFLLLIVPSIAFAQVPSTLTLLQDLIRIDTSNPPGNETEAARYVQKVLAGQGIDSEIIESSPGRGNLIARLAGSGTGEPIALLGHLDVVPADPKEWDVPPFSGEIKDGQLWGRGSLDMKGLVAMEVAAFLRAKREALPLKRDLILILVADEEAGGLGGAGFLVKDHWEKVKAKYLFNEGSVGVQKMGLNLYPVQVAEKGVAWMKLTAHGTSGHGSMPHDDNAVMALAGAIGKLPTEFPIVYSPVIEAFLKGLAPHLSTVKKIGADYFFHPWLGSIIQKIARRQLSNDRALSAVLSNTVSPTMLEAGYKVNVIPAEATASIDCRIMPGETPEHFREKIQKIVGDRVSVTLEVGSLPNESPFDTPYFRVISEALKKEDRAGVVLPMMSAGATDSRYFRAKGTIAYGIVPILLPPEGLSGLHGKNERIPVEGLEKGAEVVYQIVQGGQDLP